MNNFVRNIYLDKIREIESRTGVKFSTTESSSENTTASFDNILNNKIDSLNTSNYDTSNESSNSTTTLSQNNYNIDSKNISQDIESSIEEASKTYGLDKELIKSVINAESSFNPNSTSKAGAMGLMQLMPGTAKSLGVNNPYDVKQNIMGGTKYLSSLIDKYDDVKLGLASYNAGPGNVNKYGGIPPFKETQNYVSKIIKSYENAKKSGI